MEVERPPQTSIELYQSWRRYGILGHDTQLILHPINRASSSSASSSGSLALISLRAPSNPNLSALIPRTTYTSLWTASSSNDFKASPKSNTTPYASPSKPHKSSPPPATFPFHAPTKRTVRFQFPPSQPAKPRRGTKRYRHASDVDGPLTAQLSSKKRRLRGQLITSRLSQPFSQPATHILNREGLEAGDKRFLKLAGSIDSARRVGHLHATSFLRFSVMNRLRRRLDIGRPGRGQEEDVKRTGHMPVLAQSPQANSGGKYLKPSSKSATMEDAPRSTSPTSSASSSSSCPQPTHSRSIQQPPTCRLSKPTALPMPSSDAAATMHRTPPQIHPVPAPDAKPARSMYDDFDEDSFAFLHSEDEGSGSLTDDPEDVYCDFGAIFGGASDAESQAGEDHTYEEYFDELDGISWATK